MKAAPGTSPARTETHQRLLDAAARVFSRSGLEGATTREIAREAGVNEVTLFRHFRSKEKLLAEVVRCTFDRQNSALAASGHQATALAATEAPEALGASVPGPANLRESLRQLARRYEAVLRANMPFVRTMIGEIHRYSEHEARVMFAIFAPLKAELLATVQAAERAGELRPGVDATIAADLFGGMVFVEALRRSGPTAPDYSTEQYQAACVDVFVRGIER